MKSVSSESLLQMQPPTSGNLITILSIDGGGVRGIIPATILEFLESQLQVKFILDRYGKLEKLLQKFNLFTEISTLYLHANYKTFSTFVLILHIYTYTQVGASYKILIIYKYTGGSLYK